MSNIFEIKSAVKGVVRDESEKLTARDENGLDSYDWAIAAAIKTFSKHRPDVAVVDITGDGTHDYALPTTWVEGFSEIIGVEYPVGNVPEDYLDDDEYKIYQGTSARKIRLINYMPSASETFRVTFTIPRTDATIPANDEDAFCNLAAAFCLEQLANALLHSTDSLINADSVDYKDKSYKAAARAKRLMQLYKEHLGIKEDDVSPAASAVSTLKVNYPGGSDRLTHPRRLRDER